jgi:hypothetical protein
MLKICYQTKFWIQMWWKFSSQKIAIFPNKKGIMQLNFYFIFAKFYAQKKGWCKWKGVEKEIIMC